jgi:CelD/BcsL family acetyltransferase involved in cellulose biosynthesis
MTKDPAYFIDSEFTAEEWNNYLSSTHSTVYHTLEWRSVLENLFHYRTFYALCRHNRDIVGILPLAFVRSWITGKRVVSLPYSQYGGPIVSDVRALDCMVEHLVGYLSQGFEYVRLRPRERLDEGVVDRAGLKKLDYYARCVIPLENRNDDDVREHLHKSVIRSIKASIRAGIHIENCDYQHDGDIIQTMMFQTCKKHGVPPYPPTLLDAIHEKLVSKNLARTFVARLEGRVIAALIMFTMSGEGIYAYNFSDRKYLRLRPNNALIWAAIQWSLENRLSIFDLGISSPQDNQLLPFKKRWGAVEHTLREYFITRGDKPIVPDRRASLKYKWATMVWRHLVPNYFASKFGPALLSHID